MGFSLKLGKTNLHFSRFVFPKNRAYLDDRYGSQPLLRTHEGPVADAEIIDIADRNRGARRHIDILDRAPPPNAVRTMQETAALASISVATLKRLIKDGMGPRVTQVSPRRKGVTDLDRVAWLEGCAK